MNKVKALIEKQKAKSKSLTTKRDLDDLYENLEKLLEDTSKRRDFEQNVSDYVAHKIKEIRSLRRARKWMICLSATLSISVLAIFYFILLCPVSALHIGVMDGSGGAVFISASFISSFGLIAIVAKGVLGAGSNNEQSPPLPVSIQALMDALNK